jgi:hypothetical protein
MKKLVRWFRSLFLRQRVILKLTNTTPLQAEDFNAILQLKYHPGFQALTRLLAIQREGLINQLASTRHEDIRAVDRLQAGIAWIGYLEDEVRRRTVRASTPKAKKPELELLEEFDRAKAHYEMIGPQG